MQINGIIHKNAIITILDTVSYNMETKQAEVRYTVQFDDVVYERVHWLTQEQTASWWEDDNYLVDLLCDFNWFTKSE